MHQPTHDNSRLPSFPKMLQSFFSPKLVILMVFLYGRLTASTAQEITVSSGFLSTHMIEPTLQVIFYVLFLIVNVIIHSAHFKHFIFPPVRLSKRYQERKLLNLNFSKTDLFSSLSPSFFLENCGIVIYLICSAHTIIGKKIKSIYTID